ncbi:MAG: amidohydrolase family protein [Patescibacteria group bacterium]|nr:amidohydrolase family protein [Patescibacteria group bacterium]MDE2015713.1 amidohydrolase family protein [Patescibacteria group bacterium]MDE2226771.1 amidohydrolase family protein [Patescibacteria group bacterium]
MTLLIKNVKILGSAEKFSGAKDVFVSGDKISAIGNFSNKTADDVFEGKGAYLSPGFIDVNTDSDHYLSILNYPEQSDFLEQGVTTIIGGMCGSSLAPLIYGSLESVRKWGDIRKVNVNWHTMGEFLDVLQRKKLAVNFATLIGHATIRRAIVGESLRDLTKNELKIFGETLKRGLSDGGFGFSTGLGYVHGAKVPYAEIKFLAEITKSFNGVYATHLRGGESNIYEATEEAIKIAEGTGVKTLISHFMPFQGTKSFYEKSLKRIEGLPNKLDLHFDVYPYDTSLLALYTFLPQWAQNGGNEKMLRNINDEWLGPKIKNDFPELDAENFIVARAPGNSSLVGKTLEDISEIYGVSDQASALMQLMLTTKLKAVVLYKNINNKLIRRAIGSSRSFIASNSPSLSETESVGTLKPERTRSTFTKFIGLALSEKLLSLDKIIQKITSEPAAKFNLRNRGVVKEGNFADLAVWSYSQGDEKAELKLTVVNGDIAFKKGEAVKKFSGQPLRHMSS